MSLQFTQCSYRYGRNLPVLNELDLHIDSGSTVLLGPNGAGKSTLIGIAASRLEPSNGSVSWRGINPALRRERAAYRRAVGWLPQSIHPMPSLTVRENVAYIGWLKGLSRSTAWSESASALDRVRLAELANRRSHELSGGQLRRMGIAGTLVHWSELVLMDEPTAGLDPAQRHAFRELLTDLSDDIRFIVATHQTEDLSELYESVVVLEQGSVRYQGSVEDFLALASTNDAIGKRAENAYNHLVRREA